VKGRVKRIRQHTSLGLWKTTQRMTRSFALLVVLACISCFPVKEDTIKFILRVST
jgi:hypothetical protein